ncbi:MAG: sugar transferase [Cyclobacteriaceae bacterium]|nr:sugar transferase [Cyclobacteriaceae bacterium]
MKLRTIIGEREGNNERVINNVLFIGNQAVDICESLDGFNYTGLSVDTFGKAFIWLENQILGDTDLPSVIISDFSIEGNSAFSFYSRISSNKFFSSIPFIIVTRESSAEDRTKALKLGIDDFYTGSFSADDIYERVDFLSRYKKDLIKFEAAPQISMNYFVPMVKMPFLKRLADILISSFLLLILSPALAIIALLIRLESRGPVFYSQKRAGKGYRVFDFYKFRSMRVGADAELKNLAHLNQYNGNGKKSTFFKIENDPRITKIGKILRNTSIDEIPQLFNVLKGDMSLVGNRPLPLYEAEQLTRDQWARRFLAPAGITGLWQVTKRGRGEMSEEERIELDIAYADKSSFWFDLLIMLRTVPALFQKENV